MRLSRSSAFLCVVHRSSAIDAPARFTTASAPTPAPPNSPVAGFHATATPSLAPSPPALCGRTNRHMVCPARASALTSAVPTSPDEPVTRIFIFLLFVLLRPARTKPHLLARYATRTLRSSNGNFQILSLGRRC